jgi:hypothetical protein
MSGPGLYKTRGGWGYWRWVHVRRCEKCGARHNVLGNDTRLRPCLPVGAIMCHCGGLIPLGGA